MNTSMMTLYHKIHSNVAFIIKDVGVMPRAQDTSLTYMYVPEGPQKFTLELSTCSEMKPIQSQGSCRTAKGQF